MPDYQWPDAEHRTLIGKRISRVDSPDKVSGRARYTYDVKRPEMLFGKMLRAPYAHCKVVSVDVSAAEKIPGVKAIEIQCRDGTDVRFSFASGKVGTASPVEPYRTLKSGTVYAKELLYLNATTLYVACGSGSERGAARVKIARQI